ncbi:MAG: hypothetical protein DME64_11985 [Verrucomicrobia bacterium]|nr:MAG: hypothetical protein DME64_11985 [Verrucomicrobiota bacterium]
MLERFGTPRFGESSSCKTQLLDNLSSRSLELHVGPIEAVDGTPVIDIKPILPESTDS